MVERLEGKNIEEFVGKLERVTYEDCPHYEGQTENRQQYHLEIRPEDVNLLAGSKTGMMHCFLRQSPKGTDDKVVQDSVIDRYLMEVENLFPEVKKMTSVKASFEFMKGKKILWRLKRVGKAYNGKPASEEYCPLSIVE